MEKVFQCTSQLTFDTTPSQHQQLLQIIKEENVRCLGIDLHQVKECDSAGLALLIEAKRLCKQYHKSLWISGASADMLALAEFCGVDGLINDRQ